MKSKSATAICFLLITITSVCTAFAQERPQSAETPIVTWKDGDPNCDQIVVEGKRYRTINHNGLLIAFNFFEDDSLCTAFVAVTNDSDRRVLVDPATSLLALWEDSKKSASSVVQPIPVETIAAAARQVSEKAADVMKATLKANTVFPERTVSGEIHFEKKKFASGFFAIQIGETIYRFRIRSEQK